MRSRPGNLGSILSVCLSRVVSVVHSVPYFDSRHATFVFVSCLPPPPPLHPFSLFSSLVPKSYPANFHHPNALGLSHLRSLANSGGGGSGSVAAGQESELSDRRERIRMAVLRRAAAAQSSVASAGAVVASAGVNSSASAADVSLKSSRTRP